MGGPLPGLCALAAAYMLSQFFRTALAVVAPEIAADLGLDPARLGFLSSTWFVAFAAAQIPIGVMLDHVGPRRTCGIVFAAAALGCVVFATAGSLAWAACGQALIGVGCAPVFMSTLVVLARWYPPARFATLSSIVLATGSLGTVLGATPLALAAHWLGWRGAILGMGGLVAVASLLVLLLVRDRPAGMAAPPRETLAGALRGVAEVMRNRSLLLILPISFTGYAVLVTVRGLWAGPYLAEVFGMDAVARGNVLLLMSLGIVGGTLVYGMLERRLDRRRLLVLCGCCAVITCLALLALVGSRSALLASILLVGIGTCGATYAIVMAQARRFLADKEVGRGFTLLNCACFAGAALLQAITGLVLSAAHDAGITGPGAFSILFAFIAGWLGIAAAIHTRSRDLRLSRAVAGR
ncbi:MAG: MFS transporter [Geminicoccaceae bacterium]